MCHENVVFAAAMRSGPVALVLAVHHQRWLHVECAILGKTLVWPFIVLLFMSSTHNLSCAAHSLRLHCCSSGIHIACCLICVALSYPRYNAFISFMGSRPISG